MTRTLPPLRRPKNKSGFSPRPVVVKKGSQPVTVWAEETPTQSPRTNSPTP